MFMELFELARSAPLTMVVSADAASRRMTVVVMPKPGAESEPALATPLALTATPEEFDGGFVAALANYREEHRSLAEQAAATAEVLAAAREASLKKGASASKPVAKPAKAPAPAAVDEGGSDEDGDEGGATVTAAAGASPADAVPAGDGTLNLFG